MTSILFKELPLAGDSMEEECDVPLFGPPRARSLPTERPYLDTTHEQAVNPTVGKVKSFTQLGLDAWIVSMLHRLALREPTDVQAACIPQMIAGREVFAAAKTGSGKTAAFALPILQELSRNPCGNFAIVLTPTRELAFQIADQFRLFGRPINVSVATFVGGMDMVAQAMELTQRPHIIVATPGRLADLLESGQVRLSTLRYLIFDEADRLLSGDSSFMRMEIPTILEHIVSPRVCWSYFSATMSSCVRQFHNTRVSSRKGTLDEIFEYNGNTEFGTVEHLRQSFMLVPSQVRDAHLVALLRQALVKKTVIIFTGKCKTCELVFRMLKNLRIASVCLHGQMSQRARLAALNAFRAGSSPVLVTTDVGSRGLDIPLVDTVVNFDLPADARDYVHRIGRAARAGRAGEAISFVNEIDMSVWRAIESKVGKSISLYEHASPESHIVTLLNEVIAAKREASMQLEDVKFGNKREWNKKKWKAVEKGAKLASRS